MKSKLLAITATILGMLAIVHARSIGEYPTLATHSSGGRENREPLHNTEDECIALGENDAD